MSEPLLLPTLLKALDIEEKSPSDQLSFLSSYGDEIFSTAIEQLEGLLSGPDLESVQRYLESEPELEELVVHLLMNYEEFAVILKAVTKEVVSE